MTVPQTAVISVDMGGTKIFGMVNRLNGEVVAERTLPTRGDDSASGYDQLVRLIEALIVEAEQHEIEVAGIGLGVPGMTDRGRVIAAPPLDWIDEPVGERLRARFGLPVSSTARAAAVFCQWACASRSRSA